ncbi:unnamed protein product [Chironomus riparius]|uniref:RING-type domain-containing protein n=1 Tax=Chironomus riparius TaxID=315576 RepID=A0A9N9RP07_9DIPT|nr:unnamed protein product [Chironomus riparius]
MINSVLLTSSISTIFPLVAFIITVIAFILLFFVKVVNQGDVIRQSSMSINATVQIPQIKMTKVHIPFTFRLETQKDSDEAVKFVISSNVKYTLQAFFNVSIRELHMSMWRSWNEIRESVHTRHESIIDPAHCKQLAVDLRDQQPHAEERTIVIKSLGDLNLGKAPRQAYPLVVFLIKADCENENLDDTVLLMNVIHIRDTQCPLPTSVLAQYLKQASGQLSCLKQLYLSSVDSDGEYSYSKTGSLSLAEPVACTSDSLPILCSDTLMPENNDQLCVVCRFYPLSRALLPCRHTVLCAICFSKLDRCPICRSPITSYFCIRSEDYISSHTTIIQEPKSRTSFIDAINDFINDRLTDFLGFR